MLFAVKFKELLHCAHLPRHSISDIDVKLQQWSGSDEHYHSLEACEHAPLMADSPPNHFIILRTEVAAIEIAARMGQSKWEVVDS